MNARRAMPTPRSVITAHRNTKNSRTAMKT